MLVIVVGGALIGLSLGLMGSGGSILTVPVLTLLLGQDEKVAIAGSLAIVGTIALVGSLPHARSGHVDGRSVLWFGLPGMVGAWSGVWVSRFVPGSVQIAVFAGLMLVAAVFMFRPPVSRERAADAGPRSPHKIVLEGLAVGCLTGFVGVGGGFLIVPALVLLGGLDMRRAIGTSLVIIALKSAAGFVGALDVLADLGLSLDYTVVGMFAALGVAGSLVGRALGGRIDARSLERTFACFLLLIGAVIVLREVGAWSI